MLKEIAVTPEVWLDGTFSTSEHQDLVLTALWKGVEQGAIIRNLSDGNWHKTLAARLATWHPRAKEVLRKLRPRIIDVQRCRSTVPVLEIEWLDEAFESHKAVPQLSNIFLTDTLASCVKSTDYGSIAKATSKLPFCEPFSGGACSNRLRRDTQAYIDALHSVLKYSNIICFIDPYVAPGLINYAKFPDLLNAVVEINPNAQIEIHRVILDQSANKIVQPNDWFSRFSAWIRADKRLSRLKVSVTIWDDFHDRYLASNLIGVSVPHGFDTSNKSNDFTRWTLLSRVDRDDLFQEFSPSDPHKRRTLKKSQAI